VTPLPAPVSPRRTQAPRLPPRGAVSSYDHNRSYGGEGVEEGQEQPQPSKRRVGMRSSRPGGAAAGASHSGRSQQQHGEGTAANMQQYALSRDDSFWMWQRSDKEKRNNLHTGSFVICRIAGALDESIDRAKSLLAARQVPSASWLSTHRNSRPGEEWNCVL
jgi:hypothetical protein